MRSGEPAIEYIDTATDEMSISAAWKRNRASAPNTANSGMPNSARMASMTTTRMSMSGLDAGLDRLAPEHHAEERSVGDQ